MISTTLAKPLLSLPAMCLILLDRAEDSGTSINEVVTLLADIVTMREFLARNPCMTESIYAGKCLHKNLKSGSVALIKGTYSANAAMLQGGMLIPILEEKRITKRDSFSREWVYDRSELAGFLITQRGWDLVCLLKGVEPESVSPPPWKKPIVDAKSRAQIGRGEALKDLYAESRHPKADGRKDCGECWFKYHCPSSGLGCTNFKQNADPALIWEALRDGLKNQPYDVDQIQQCAERNPDQMFHLIQYYFSTKENRRRGDESHLINTFKKLIQEGK